MGTKLIRFALISDVYPLNYKATLTSNGRVSSFNNYSFQDFLLAELNLIFENTN